MSRVREGKKEEERVGGGGRIASWHAFRRVRSRQVTSSPYSAFHITCRLGAFRAGRHSLDRLHLKLRLPITASFLNVPPHLLLLPYRLYCAHRMIPTLSSSRRCDSSTRDCLVFSHRRLRPTISQKPMHKQASFFQRWTLADPPQPSHVAFCTVCHDLHMATHRAHQPMGLAAGTRMGGHWDTRDGRGRFPRGEG